MGYLPRLILRHTSELEKGQIYLPTITWSLYLGVVLLVLGFQSSSNLASAYGIAVTGTMLTTSLLYWFVAKRTLGWSMISVAAIVLVFVSVDVIFLSSNLTKISEGWVVASAGWIWIVCIDVHLAPGVVWLSSIVSILQKVTLDTSGFLP